MVTCKNIDNDAVVGRLGNKMFVIATAIAIAKDCGDECILPDWKYKDIFPNIKVNSICVDNDYTEPYYHYTPIKYSNNMSLNGYFQSYKYFDSYKDVLLNYYLKMNIRPELNNLYDYNNIISIHIRRTDYLNLKEYHTNLPTSYYISAIKTLSHGKKILVFSDDIPWCKSVMTSKSFIFSEGLKDYEDLYVMSLCKHNIIANSSFSWWAAYMNKNKDKKVIAPKQWFGPACKHDTRDLIPKDWILI